MLYIDAVQDYWPDDANRQGKGHLLLIAKSGLATLESLERRLNDWAVDEGYYVGDGD